MQEQCPLVPDGISHDIDLSALTPEALDAHHLKGLRLAGFLHGATGQSEYRQRHPEAAHLRGTVSALAYSPRPQGYDAAITDTVAQWFNCRRASAATNRTDVERLNARLGTTRFNPGNHFSKPLSPSLLAKVQEVCAGYGLTLPARKGLTLAQVKQAIRAGTAQAAPDAQPFAGIGTRTGNSLTIAGRSYSISLHSARECIWVTAEGGKQRVFLTTIAALFAGVGREQSSPYLLHSNTGDRLPRGETGALPSPPEPMDLPSPIGRSSPASQSMEVTPLYGRSSPAADPIDPEPLTTAEKMDRLTAAVAARAAAWESPAQQEGPDPLTL